MKNKVNPLVIILLLLISSVSQAADNKYVNLQLMIAKTFPGAEVTDIKETAIKGMIEFKLDAQVLYATEDGLYLFKGDIFDLVKQENITEKSKQISRVAVLKELGEKNMLVYEPKERKRFVTVFTDIDCPYCRRLHEEVPQYIEKGIAVRYLFMPFKGKKSLEKSVSVMCAKDPQKAMTNAKEGRRIRNITCDNPVKLQMEAGQKLGIRGTPAIILDNGEMVPGYRPVNEIAKKMGL